MLLTELLNFHLSRSIERLLPMSEYSDTAARFKAMREARKDRLKALSERMDKHETHSDEVFRKYEGAVEAMEDGMKEMEEEAREMSNDFETDDKGGKTVDKTVVDFQKTDKTDTAA
jgi:exonuclease VII small subunit